MSNGSTVKNNIPTYHARDYAFRQKAKCSAVAPRLVLHNNAVLLQKRHELQTSNAHVIINTTIWEPSYSIKTFETSLPCCLLFDIAVLLLDTWNNGGDNGLVLIDELLCSSS
jgi:hypothetical protein